MLVKYSAAVLAFIVMYVSDCLQGYSRVDTITKPFVCEYFSDTLTVRFGYLAEDVVKCLQAHKSAQSLELTESGIEYIPSYIDILTNLLQLNLSYNALNTANFSSIPNICPRLKIVVLDRNNITTLRRGDLDCLHSLEKLSISNNTLAVIENGTFNENVSNIDYIHLVYNDLTSLDTSLISRLKISNNITVIINASWNNIGFMTNSIHLTIENFALSTTVGVYAVHNNITTLNVDYYLSLFNVTNYVQLLYLWNCGFDIRFNPLICDCAMFPAAKLLAKYQYMDPDNPVFSLTCNSPPPLQGKLVREVPDNQFNCSVTERCPKLCYCNRTVALNLVTVYCGPEYESLDLPNDVPSSEYNEIHMSYTQMNRVSFRDYLTNTTVFDVSESAISDIEPSVISALQSATLLKFDNNKFEYIPKTFESFNFSNGQTLTLHGNPFSCDCNNLWMKRWILKNKQNILYFDKILCSKGPGAGSAIVDVPDDKFVCISSSPPWTVIIIASVAFVITILIVTITSLRKDRIKVFLISRSSLFRRYFGKNGRREYKYDIFIPHSCADDQTVHEIVDMLENASPPFTVCLGERNFPLGRTITENILNAIENSRTTLLLVSNNFLQSSWCNMEFREAHTRFLRDRTINMTLVLLEELDERFIYDELQIYMKSHVYIKYSDSDFWNKLFANLRCDYMSESTPLISR